MKKPFIHALLAAGYIAFVAIGLQLTTYITKDLNGTILIPMTMLSLFVLSAAVIGFLFLSEPMKLLFESKKHEAVVWFLKAVGFFACFVFLFATLTLIF